MKTSRIIQLVLIIVVLVAMAIAINSNDSTPDTTGGMPAQFQP
jgi:hypothetical protein